MSNKLIRGAQLAAVAATALAITNITTPVIYEVGTNPLTLLVLRALFTSLAVGLILLATGRMRRLPFQQEVQCAFSGFLFTFAGIGLLNSLALIPASLAVLVLYLFPIITILLDALVRRTMPKPITFMLLIVALGGLALVLEVDSQFEVSAGVLLALLAACSAASTFVWNNHMLKEVDPEQITFRMFLFSFLIFAVWITIAGQFQLPPTTLGKLQFAGLLGIFALAFLSMFRASQMTGSVRASMIMNLEPVVTIFLSVIVFSQSLTALQYLGALLVLTAVVVSQKYSNENQ